MLPRNDVSARRSFPAFSCLQRAAQDTIMPEPVTAPSILDFWRKAGRDRWFAKDDSFDMELRHRFEFTREAAAAGRLEAWAETPDGALALVLLLDQLPRNLFRGSAEAF